MNQFPTLTSGVVTMTVIIESMFSVSAAWMSIHCRAR